MSHWSLISQPQTATNIPYCMAKVFCLDTKIFFGKSMFQYVLLQDLIERAIIETISPNANEKIPGLAFKETPSKCWNSNNFMTIMLFPLPIALFIAISFLPCPSNFLHQVLTEKELKLREYLYIVGVGSLTLKLSWILFYSIFLIPLSIIVGLLVSLTLPGHIWNFTNPILIIVIFITYNISQLSLCYMFTNLLSSPKHSTALLNFLHMFFTMTSIMQAILLDFNGSKLTFARLSSLYPVTPLIFAVKYLTSWEQQWQAVQLKNFFMSPVETDEYGGLGETFLWLLFDICFYLILAWYFEKIFPGEFGQKHPFYFPIMPRFWFSNKFKTYESDIRMDKCVDVESVSDTSHTPGVVLDQLTKIYPGGKIAVDQLTLTFYKNEITAFLGQNGAGKSTTMNCLVGVTTATSGQVCINGMEMGTQMHNIRKIVGYVPQHDILYPSLTVKEHLQFFGWLKGMTKCQVEERADPILTLLGLDHLKQTETTNLSGGQKRKLSIITGYLGFPEVIIFDEPTSGIDPTSRRDIWELFLSHKKDSTTILSTHFMEEADILGDKVAIIHEGQLKCSGSPMYLKQKYGKGMIITIARDATLDRRDEITEFVTMNIEGSQLIEERGLDMSFLIPNEIAGSDSMVDFLEKVENGKEDIGIVSYGISEPSMEKVFFETIGESHFEPDFPNNADQQFNEDEASPQLEYEAIIDENNVHTSQNRLLLLGAQAAALFYKRLLSMVHNWYIIMLQIFVPLVFIGLLLLINGAFGDLGKAIFDQEKGAESVSIHDNSKENVMFVMPQDLDNSVNVTAFLSAVFGDEIPENMLREQKDTGNTTATCPDCFTYCDRKAADKFQHGYIPNEGTILYILPAGTNITAWILSINQTGNTVIGGFLFQDTEPTDWINAQAFLNVADKKLKNIFLNSTSNNYVTVWYQERFRFAVLNFMNNILLRMRLGPKVMPKIELKFKQAQLYNNTDEDIFSSNGKTSFFDFPLIIISGIFVTISFMFATVPSALFVQSEISSGLKRLQMICGVNPIVYWTVNYMFDFVLFCITCGICYIPLLVFKNPYQPEKKNKVTDQLDSITDPDVKAEQIRVGTHEGEVSDALVIQNLVKKYPKMKVPAVAGVSFGVTASQCFGLLGLNGAGKTTTFKILTGYTRPTSGEALLNNRALFRRSWSRFKDSSYCPQDNVLFPALTVEQHIKVFACFRAIPYSNITGIMNKLIHDVGLQNHRSKRAGQLSGGNQRKLQLALALLDHRPVIFLDEPTTGMDPGARRKAWNLIKCATAAGSAIVLTSHSMEECEVLCHRLVIMVAGTFHCIGSVQYLKDKFGNKYTFKIKLRPQVSDGHIDFANTMNQVKEFIKTNIALSELREEHATMLEFEVASTKHTNLPTIFKVLSKCRNEFAIEDISITQTTLEQLFINMSKKHEDREANI